MDTKLEYKDNTICKTTCKGKCCKLMGCHLSPLDIKGSITYENLKEMLLTGHYSIDWWDNYNSKKYGFINGYYLRMRNKNSDIVDPSYHGVCSLLTENGCTLPYEDRPLGARALEPGINGCTSHYTKRQSVEDWEEYYPILSKLRDEF